MKNSNINILIPHKLTNDSLRRFGSKNDGGYVFPENILKNLKTLVSLGIKDDWSFEKDYIKLKNNKVIAYDLVSDLLFFIKFSIISFLKLNFSKSFKYFINSIQFLFFFELKPNISFFKKGISNNKAGFLKLCDIFKNNNLKENVILSIDIEGDEYSIIDDLVNYSDRIDSVSLEFHNICSKSELFFDSINTLNKNYKIVHIHFNNYTPICKNLKISDCLEITFVNNKFNTTDLKRFEIPTSLDSPCDSQKKDHHLILNKN